MHVYISHGASRAAPGKSGLHARGEGERVLALESREGTRASRREEMATHSSVLAWRIPGMVEPDGLPSMGSHRVGHDCNHCPVTQWTDQWLGRQEAGIFVLFLHLLCSHPDAAAASCVLMTMMIHSYVG